MSIYYKEESYKREQSSNDHKTRWNNLSDETTSHYSNYIHGLSKIKSNESILDLGSGNGDFVALVRQKLPISKITAVDWFMPSELFNALIDINIEPFSSSINVESLQKCNFKSFDIITMWEVIEHIKIQDLKDLLKYLKNLLKKDGTLIISTPDFDDPHSKSLDFWSMAPGEHLSVFNEFNITNILEKCGYYVEKISKESVTIKLSNAWYKYGSITNSSMAGKASAIIIEQFLSNDKWREDYRKYCRNNQIGSEMIIFARKN